MDKSGLIQTFVQFYNSLPKQGTVEWLSGRSQRFGGSELATLFNLDKYKNLITLIKEKLGLIETPETLQRLIFLNWGNNFEIAHQLILEDLLCTEIHELRSIPWHHGVEFCAHELNYDLLKPSYIHISPDGIALIKKANIMKILDKHNPHIRIYGSENIDFNAIDDEVFVMFEQKAPYSREIDSRIPEYYVPQVKGGMCVIPFSDFAIYTESVFRIARVNDVINKNYTHLNMPISQKKIINKTPFKRGLIGYYAKLGTQHTEEIIRRFAQRDLTDLQNYCEIFEMFKFVKLREYIDVEIICFNDDTNSQSRTSSFESSSREGYYFIGFLGWFLYEISIHFVDRNPNYLFSKYDEIKKTCEFIEEQKNIPAISDAIVERNFVRFLNN